MGGDNRSGKCLTGKVRYSNAEQAGIALDRVRVARLEKPDGLPPESRLYLCRDCDGYHLSSKRQVNVDSAQRGVLEKAVSGALACAIDAHGPITREDRSSATKRVVSALFGLPYAKGSFASRVLKKWPLWKHRAKGFAA